MDFKFASTWTNSCSRALSYQSIPMHLQNQEGLDPPLGNPAGRVDRDAPCLPSIEKKPINEGWNERYEIASLLRGQKIDIPDLHRIFEGWPAATNIHLDSLRIAVDENLNKYELCRAYSESCNQLISSQALPAWKTSLKDQGCRYSSLRSNVVALCIFQAPLHCNLSFHLGRFQTPLTRFGLKLTITVLQLFAWDDGVLFKHTV